MTCNRTLRRSTTAALCAGALLLALGAPAPASAQIDGASTGICVDYDGSYFTCDSGGGGGGGGYDDGGYGYGFDPNMFAFDMGMGLLGQMLNGFMTCALDPNCGGGGGSDNGPGYD